MKIVFMGTPDFAVPTLMSLALAGQDIALVVTQPDRAKDRGKKLQAPPVKLIAEKIGIRVLQPEKIKGNEEFAKTLKEIEPDIIVVVAYGKILPKEILDIPKLGCINVHGSLLPRFRGAAPIQHAILEGDEKTGITIMRMEEGLDTGNMLSKAELEIGKMRTSELSDKLAKMGGILLVDTLPLIYAGEEGEKQDDSLSTYAGMIDKSQGNVNFGLKTAEEIERMVRAFDPWPGAYCDYEGQVMKIKAAKVIETHEDLVPGKVISLGKEGIDVACKDNILRITELQMPGKKSMDAGSFLRGNKMEVGKVLE